MQNLRFAGFNCEAMSSNQTAMPDLETTLAATEQSLDQCEKSVQDAIGLHAVLFVLQPTSSHTFSA